jgi:DnaJ family protein C protein 9
MNDEDPAKAFFPDQDEPDLYGALGLSEDATSDEIKKSYRKLALQYHPDKVSSTSGQSSEDNTKRFHQISFAYTVLSDEKRKKRFDETGRTDESFFEGEADWNAYFKELWQGEVNGKTLDDFVKSYKGAVDSLVTVTPCLRSS